ncbi:MAG: hypothetical protein ACWGQW_24845, partial [bacterium]
MKRTFLILIVSGLLLTLVMGHPHFRKTVNADMRGKEITLTFTTYPFNEAHLSQVQEGFVFHCGTASLTFSADASSGPQAIPAGEYFLRARATTLDNWTLILVPAAGVENSYELDVSNGIRLECSTLTGQPLSHHLALDLNSGHGDSDGKMVLSVSYGSRT